jgi:hypothetical protein
MTGGISGIIPNAKFHLRWKLPDGAWSMHMSYASGSSTSSSLKPGKTSMSAWKLTCVHPAG